MSKSDPDFYEQLEPIKDFLKLDDASYYQQAPSDWLMVLSDIRGSTKAIQAGKYKLVNMLGASSIAAVVNSLLHEGHSRDIPFVFGGDGATALVPSRYHNIVCRALSETQRRAESQFQMDLRVGIVPLSDLVDSGTPVFVAKYELSKDNYIAFFKGKGLAQGESWIKSGRYLIEKNLPAPEFDPLMGLSCRWAPLTHERGVFLTVLIKLNERNYHPEILPRLVQQIDQIVGLDHPETRPVKAETMTAENVSLAVNYEAALQSGSQFLTKLKSYLIVLLAIAFDKGWLKSKAFNMQTYKQSVQVNSDYRKYDEALRMVLDCNIEMVTKLRSLLEEYHQKQLIFYGLKESDSALMTCFVQDTAANQHIHFIDGGDGGYAIAALQLKEQIKSDSEKP
jgi:hypothetical protein